MKDGGKKQWIKLRYFKKMSWYVYIKGNIVAVLSIYRNLVTKMEIKKNPHLITAIYNSERIDLLI